jgi:hypothetical protein
VRFTVLHEWCKGEDDDGGGKRRALVGSGSEDIAKRLAYENLRPALTEWRAAHPQATMWEIEGAVEEHLAGVRAEFIEELAEKSRLREICELSEAERPRCERCGSVLRARGQRSRTLQDKGGEDVVLRRSYADCPTCRVGVFPPR